MTPAQLGIILLGAFAVFYFKGIWPTVTAILGLLSVVLLGTSGWLGHFLTTLTGWTEHWVGTVTTDALGVAFTGLLTLVFGIMFVHDVHPKHSATKATAWIGVALGAIIVAGATGIPALSGLHGDITGLANDVLHL